MTPMISSTDVHWKLLLGVAMFCAALVPEVEAQTLGKLAKQEKARREAIEEPSPVYTDADVITSGRSRSTTGSEARQALRRLANRGKPQGFDAQREAVEKKPWALLRAPWLEPRSEPLRPLINLMDEPESTSQLKRR